MKISVIIPVYNVEQYLRRCLDSCLNQDLPENEFELIVVNDGSPDRSIDIIREYSAKYSNIVVVDKPNGGLSSARNAGLKKASGDYVWFVDSDDWIESKCLQEICRKMEQEKLDLLTFEAVISDGENKNTLPERRNLKEDTIYSGIELYQSGYVYPYSGAPFYVFDRKFLLKNELFFFEGILFEDILFSARMMARVQRCAYVDGKYYFYYVREGSITRSKSTVKKGIDAIKIADIIHDEQLENEKYANNLIYNNCIAGLISAVYTHWCGLSGIERNFVRLNFIERDYWCECIRKSRRYKYFIMFLLIKLNIPLKINKSN